MDFEFNCPSCSGHMRVREENIGSKVRCPHCELTVQIPGHPDDNAGSNLHIQETTQPAPPTPKRSSKRESKHKRKSSRNGTPWAAVGGLIGTTVVLCVLIAIQFSGDGEPHQTTITEPQTTTPPMYASASIRQTAMTGASVTPNIEPQSAAERAVEFERPSGGAITVSNIDHLPEAKQIDQMILANLKKQGVEPMPLMNDEAFLRRIFLDVAGRIPTYGEAYYFLNDQDPQKRTKLIDNLLNSGGYVSNFYNYWCDILRVKSNLNNNVPGQPYMDWIRKSLIQNKPYDVFVRELITARGHVWDNGAAGYYQRDRGMPLDNMANTAQVFLGTQLQCAQCHDHPFDVWTQMEFYQMAAFTYGVGTNGSNIERKIRGMIKNPTERNETFGTFRNFLRPISRKTTVNVNKQLRLPDNYGYDDAKPKTIVKPAVFLGDDKVNIKKGENPTIKYAKWMTSPKNERFTLVIANRLWKRVMGLGLIEPVDDIKVDTEPTNPQLMALLERKMKDYRYDLKQYLRMLFNTQTYQRNAFDKEIDPEKPYYFPGPTFRRMTAEEAWDSLIALIIPMPEERYGNQQLPYKYQVAAKLADMKPDAILATLRKQKEKQTLESKLKSMQKQRQAAQRSKNKAKANQLDKRIADTTAQLKKLGGLERVMKNDNTDAGMDMMDAALTAARKKTKNDPRYKGYRRDLVRASELASPAPAGHFIRQFGQSDRELIENSNADASITQILSLLNGPYFDEALKPNSVLMKFLNQVETEEQKVIVIFLSMLTRMPTPQEMQISKEQIQKNGKRAYGDIIWALLNTRQFTFKS